MEDHVCVLRRSPIGRGPRRRRALTRAGAIRQDQPRTDTERDEHGDAEEPARPAIQLHEPSAHSHISQLAEDDPPRCCAVCRRASTEFVKLQNGLAPWVLTGWKWS